MTIITYWNGKRTIIKAYKRYSYNLTKTHRELMEKGYIIIDKKIEE